MEFNYEWVDSLKRTKELVDQWLEQSHVAIDTEFIRTRTFYPIPGLIQVADNQGVYLLDPTVDDGFSAEMKRLLESESTIKILHAGSEDIEIFVQIFKAIPRAIFDTQIAVTFLNLGDSMGYAKLVEMYKEVTISKEQTRSDWLQRPLTSLQLEYAAQDVYYLYQIYPEIAEKLNQPDRFDWVMIESSATIENHLDNNFDQYYLKLRQGFRLRGAKLQAIRLLCRWREKKVRQLDMPRSHLIKDHDLLQIAEKLPKTEEQLADIQGVSSRFVRRFGKDIEQIVEQSMALSQESPVTPIPAPLKKESSYLMKAAKIYIEGEAVKLDLPISVLSKKKVLEEIILDGQFSGDFTLKGLYLGWRKALVGEGLIKSLTEAYQNALKTT